MLCEQKCEEKGRRSTKQTQTQLPQYRGAQLATIKTEQK